MYRQTAIKMPIVTTIYCRYAMCIANRQSGNHANRASSAAKRLRNGVWYNEWFMNKVLTNCEHSNWEWVGGFQFH